MTGNSGSTASYRVSAACRSASCRVPWQVPGALPSAFTWVSSAAETVVARTAMTAPARTVRNPVLHGAPFHGHPPGLRAPKILLGQHHLVQVAPVGSEPLSNFNSTKVTKEAIEASPKDPRDVHVRCVLGVEMPATCRIEAPQARDDVGRAAGRNSHDQTHRPRRICLRSRDARHDRERGSARCQVQECAAAKFHSVQSAGGEKPDSAHLRW